MALKREEDDLYVSYHKFSRWTAVLVFTADTSFARGGGNGCHFGGGGHFGGGHLGGFHGGVAARGFGAMGHRFHGLLAPTATYGHRGGSWWRYSHQA